MSASADRHAELLDLWRSTGRTPVVRVPQYERPSPGYFPARVTRYAWKEG